MKRIECVRPVVDDNSQLVGWMSNNMKKKWKLIYIRERIKQVLCLMVME